MGNIRNFDVFQRRAIIDNCHKSCEFSCTYQCLWLRLLSSKRGDFIAIHAMNRSLFGFFRFFFFFFVFHRQIFVCSVCTIYGETIANSYRNVRVDGRIKPARCKRILISPWIVTLFNRVVSAIFVCNAKANASIDVFRRSAFPRAEVVIQRDSYNTRSSKYLCYISACRERKRERERERERRRVARSIFQWN